VNVAEPGGPAGREGGTPADAPEQGAGTQAVPATPVAQRRVWRLIAGLLACWLPVLLARDTVPRVAGLFALADAPSPYFATGHVFLLYVLSPLVAVSACVLLMTPGLLLAIALDRARSIDEWVLHGFALSLLTVSAAAALVQAFVPVGAGAFAGVVAGCTVLAFAAMHRRLRRAPPRWPLDALYARSALVWLLGVPAILFAALTPKFYWENFNGDGAHAFEAARLLLHQPVPFWPSGAGEIGGFPGLTSMLYAYPASWFIRLFGPFEVAARLPYLLYLPVLHAALLPLIREGRAWVPRQAERLLMWLSLVVYTMAVAFSATYSPYAADIALPATQDTLLVICFLGFSLASLRRDHGWLALFALLTFVALPNGLLLLVFWAIALLLTARRQRALAALMAVAGCLAFGLIVPRLLAWVQVPAPGGEYSGGGLLVRFAFLQLTDWSRALYVILPCGILPAFATLRWPKLDPNARAFTLVTLAYFLFVYVQAHGALHYYIPAMLLPLIVYWRLNPTDLRRWLAVGGHIIAALVAFALVLPEDATPFTEARAIGAAIDVRAGDWERMEPEAFRASTLLHEVIPYDWEPAVPESAFGTSPLVLHYYARQPKPRGAVVNYVLQRTAAAPPAGMQPVAADSAFTVYVRSTDIWNSHLALRPAAPAGSPWLAVPRGIMFRTEPLPPGFRIIDLPAIATRLGIDVDAVARRLGVQR